MFKNLLLRFCVFLQVFGKIIVYIWAGFSLFLVIAFILIAYLLGGDSFEYEYCEIDEGGTTDKEFDLCRFDCKKWSEETGCVIMDDKELEDYYKQLCETDAKRWRCREIAMEISKRKQWRKMKGLK